MVVANQRQLRAIRCPCLEMKHVPTHDEWRCSSASRRFTSHVKCLQSEVVNIPLPADSETYAAIARHQQADDKSATHIENQDAKEHPANSLWYIFPRIFSFSNCDANQLRADIGEQSGGEGAPEPQKFSNPNVVHLSKEIVGEGSVGWVPVPEADTIVVGITTEVNDKSHYNQTDQRHDFDAAKPEFEFAEDANAQKIDDENCKA